MASQGESRYYSSRPNSLSSLRSSRKAGVARRRGKRAGAVKSRRSAANPRTGGFLKITKKFFDTAVTGLAFTNPTDCTGGEADPPGLNCLNAVAQGDGESQRLGKGMLMKSVYVTGTIEQPTRTGIAATVEGGNSFYICLVMDAQTNGSQADSEAVFVNPGGIAALAANPVRNLEFTSRFRMLDSVRIDAPQTTYYNDSATTAAQSGWIMGFKLSAKLEVPVVFSGTTSSITNIVDNSLHVICFMANAEGSLPRLNYNARLRYLG